MSFSKKDVDSIIKKVINQIDKNPCIAYTEADVHSMLYRELCNNNDKLYPINLKYKGKSIRDKKNRYKTNLVHCEYLFGKDFSGKHNRMRFDLVIFDENDTKNITKYWLVKQEKDGYDAVKVKHVIEFKLELGGGGPKNRLFKSSLAKKDIDRLIDFRNLHRIKYNSAPQVYFIYMLRWLTKDKGVRSDIKKLNTDLQNHCNKHNVNYMNSINFLID